MSQSMFGSKIPGCAFIDISIIINNYVVIKVCITRNKTLTIIGINIISNARSHNILL